MARRSQGPHRISRLGVLEVAEHEGIVLGPYKDSKGIWTYGVGHTAAAGGPNPAAMKKIDTRSWSSALVNKELLKIVKLFDEDLDKYEARVNQAVKVPLTEYEFDALTSFDFNTGGVFRAKLTEFLNARNYEEAAQGFMGWLVPKEIAKRRQAEMMLFRTGKYDANGSSILVWDALPDGSMRIRGRVNSAQLAKLMQTAKTKRAPFIHRVLRVWSFFRSLF